MEGKQLNLESPMIAKILEIAKREHGDQKRKYTGEPYWHHLVEVARIAWRCTLVEDKNIVEAALLHDILEDTNVNVRSLYNEIALSGYGHFEALMILDIIKPLTHEFTSEKYPKLNRKTRMTMEGGRLILAPPKAQTVKYADIISNISSIVEHDIDFAITYVEEKEMYLPYMKKGCPVLHKEAMETVEKAKEDIRRYVLERAQKRADSRDPKTGKQAE